LFSKKAGNPLGGTKKKKTLRLENKTRGQGWPSEFLGGGGETTGGRRENTKALKIKKRTKNEGEPLKGSHLPLLRGTMKSFCLG